MQAICYGMFECTNDHTVWYISVKYFAKVTFSVTQSNILDWKFICYYNHKSAVNHCRTISK